MLSGPISICHVDFPDDSDAPTLRTLRFGYAYAEAAYRDLGNVASEENAVL